jgi:hypothetical protein
MKTESPFLELELRVCASAGHAQPGVAPARWVFESPFARAEPLAASRDDAVPPAWSAKPWSDEAWSEEACSDEIWADEAWSDEVWPDEPRSGEACSGEAQSDEAWPDEAWLDDEERDALGPASRHATAAADDEIDSNGETMPSPLNDAQRTWILALDRSALERIDDPATRKRWLDDVDWRTIEFPGNVPKGSVATDAVRQHWRLAEALFRTMAAVVPERRVPSSIVFRDRGAEAVPGQANHRLFPEARDAFVRMRAAAAADGVRLVITSSWRSAKKQISLSQNQSNPKAVAKGRSAHMYGLAVDLRMSVAGLQIREANTRTAEKMANLVRMYRSPVYKWMALRGREFGWYPYRREPWHWEYNPPGLKARFEHDDAAAATAAAARAAPVSAPAPSPARSASGGRFWTFEATTPRLTVGVYCPAAALGHSQVEVLLFAHGLLHVCGGPPSASGLVQHRPFDLATIIDASGRPLVLVVPEMDWARHRGAHPLSQPAALNALLSEALREVGRVQGRAAPALSALALAGHSRAYAFLGPLARAYAHAQMAQGALASLAEVWALDSTYEFTHSHDAASTLAWLRAKPGLRVTLAYRTGSATAPRAEKIGSEGHDRLALLGVPRSESHCALPVARLPGLLRAFGRAAVDTEVEGESPWVDDEDEFGVPAGEADAGFAGIEADEVAAHDSEWTQDEGDGEEAKAAGEAFAADDEPGACAIAGELEAMFEHDAPMGTDAYEAADQRA